MHSRLTTENSSVNLLTIKKAKAGIKAASFDRGESWTLKAQV
jgi:hypothetical protein